MNKQPNFLLEWAKVNKHHWLGDRPISQYDLWTTYTYFICSLAISSVKIFGAFILKKNCLKLGLDYLGSNGIFLDTTLPA